MTPLVRPALEDDAAAVAAIYNAALAERIATFETRERTAADLVQRIATTDRPSALLVAVVGGSVAGWAGYLPYSARECYRGVGDYSVYVARPARGQGIGRLLLAALVDRARADGCWKLVGRIFPENGSSLRMAADLGFRTVGRHERHARLDARWRDVIVVERLIEENLR